MYDSLLIDQSLGLNRRCDDEKDVKTEVRSLSLILVLQKSKFKGQNIENIQKNK